MYVYTAPDMKFVWESENLRRPHDRETTLRGFFGITFKCGSSPFI